MQYTKSHTLNRIPFHILVCLLLINCSSSTEELIERLNNKQNWNLIRARAAYSLGELKDSTAIVHLINALKDEDNDVRWAAVTALGKIEDPKAVKPLCKMLQDKDRDVRGEALVALGKISDLRAIESIRLMSKMESDSNIRSLAIRTIKSIEKSNSEKAKRKKEINTTFFNQLKKMSSKGIDTLDLNEDIPFAIFLAITFSIGLIGSLTVFHLKVIGMKNHNSSGIVKLLHNILISRGESFIRRSIIISIALLPVIIVLDLSNNNLRILWNTIGFYYLVGVSLLWLFYGISWYLQTGDKLMKRLGYFGIISSVFMWLFYEKISLIKTMSYAIHYVMNQ